MKTLHSLACQAGLLALALLLPAATPAMAAETATDKIALIPAPASLQRLEGRFEMDERTRVLALDASSIDAATRFADFLAMTQGPELKVAQARGANKGAIHFRIDPQAAGSHPDSYTLDVDPQRVVVSARDPRGLFYGAVTLWQLATPRSGTTVSIPALRIEDAPRFAWRGLMLDSARHLQSVDEIKRLLDAMALHKLNTFHWHLTDDQGWRVEIKRYPKLTSVGGCRIPAGDAGVDARSGNPRPYCGHYTQTQIREVVRYAAQRRITVVPEIDVPGHATAAIAAYPELGVLDAPPAVSNEWGVNTNLFNNDEATFVFLENVFAEVAELFPGAYVHVGGDEAVKDQWKASARVQARMRALGVKDEAGMQAYLIKRLEAFLSARGKRLIGWDEILEGGLPEEATVMSWRGIEGGLAAATQGHDVVMAPSSELYLDYLQTDSPNEPPGRPATIPLKQAYAFEPVPAALPADKRAHILGLQANVWTEHMRTFARMQHAIFPRIAAVAETGWSPRAAKDYDGFLARLPAQLQRYRALGIAYASTPFEVRMSTVELRKENAVDVALSNALGYADIRYTTDGSAPTAASSRYVAPLRLPLPAQVRAAVFADGIALAEADARTITSASLLQRRDEDLAMCTGALMLRLEDDGPVDGERAIFNADIFNPCWEWKRADLEGIGALRVRAGRLPYYFQLAHDEPHRTFKPPSSAHGELVVRAGCDGATLASAPLPAAPDRDGFLTLDLPLAPRAATQDLCLYFTGDTRPTMWTLDAVTLVPR